MIYKFKEYTPKIDESCFMADNSSVIGDVSIDEDSSVWFGAVVRADTNEITIGKSTNIQDNCTIHSDGDFPVKLGDGITIGHNCIIHGCSIKDNCLIGMGSTILNGAEIGENCMIGAGSLVTQNVKIPSGTLCLGSPAKVVRKLTDEEINSIMESAKHYTGLSKVYK